MTSTQEDVDLIRNIQQGGLARDQALHTFLIEYQIMNDSIKYLTKIKFPNTGQKDVVQDTIIAFDKNIRNGTFRQEASLKTFFYSILHFQVKNHLRKYQRHKTETLDAVPERSVIDYQIEYKERAEVLTKLLTSLGSRCKELLGMFQLNFSMREIAEQMKFSSEQVANNEVSKCKSKLREIIQSKSELVDLFKHRI